MTANEWTINDHIRSHGYGRVCMDDVGGSGMNEELKPCPNCGADMREDGEADDPV